MSEKEPDDFFLPPRRETFLARYPRKYKLFVAAVLLVGIAVSLVSMPEGKKSGSASKEVGSIFPEDGTGALPSLPRGQGTAFFPALNDQNDRTIKLVPAPESSVTEDTAEGSLPRISENGDQPWRVYARPFNLEDRRPRVALVITDLGISRAITDQAITQTPPVVTLAFNAQAAVVGAWGTRARYDGHEILIQLPVEPFDFPHSDPGPYSLLTNLSNSENLSRLLTMLRRATGYIGVTTTYGSLFTSDPQRFDLVAGELKKRGLMVLDSKMSPRSIVFDAAKTAGIPVVAITQRIDMDLSPEAIGQALRNLERTARVSGTAVGITSATPIVIHQIRAWAEGLPERGVALAPLSAMVKQ